MKTKITAILLLPLSIIFMDCKKDKTIEEETVKEYTTEVTFNHNFGLTQEVYLNGTLLNTLTFTSKQGDEIEISASNQCSYVPFTNIKDCPEYIATINLDGLEATSNSCECEDLTLNYTVE